MCDVMLSICRKIWLDSGKVSLSSRNFRSTSSFSHACRFTGFSRKADMYVWCLSLSCLLLDSLVWTLNCCSRISGDKLKTSRYRHYLDLRLHPFLSATMSASMHATGKQHGNRLGKEKSPYLLQHKDNPVDWYVFRSHVIDRSIDRLING